MMVSTRSRSSFGSIASLRVQRPLDRARCRDHLAVLVGRQQRHEFRQLRSDRRERWHASRGVAASDVLRRTGFDYDSIAQASSAVARV